MLEELFFPFKKKKKKGKLRDVNTSAKNWGLFFTE